MTRARVQVLANRDGVVDRPMQTGLVWAPPAARLEPGRLVYDALRKKTTRAGTGLLVSFLRLAEGDEQEVFRFARKYGVLELPGNPEVDEPTEYQTRRTRSGAGIVDVTVPVQRLYRAEPTAAWGQLARAFQAAIDIGAELSQGRPGTQEQWLALDPQRYSPTGYGFKPWDFPDLSKRDRAEIARLEIQIVLRAWIAQFGVQPRFWFNGELNQWQLDLDAHRGGDGNLPGLLVIQLLLVIADKEGFAICSSCHKAYVPGRKPDSSRRNYCPACGVRAAWRDAARVRRQRLRDGKAKKTRQW